jgi:hypothetical protein
MRRLMKYYLNYKYFIIRFGIASLIFVSVAFIKKYDLSQFYSHSLEFLSIIFVVLIIILFLVGREIELTDKFLIITNVITRKTEKINYNEILKIFEINFPIRPLITCTLSIMTIKKQINVYPYAIQNYLEFKTALEKSTGIEYEQKIKM